MLDKDGDGSLSRYECANFAQPVRQRAHGVDGTTEAWLGWSGCSLASAVGRRDEFAGALLEEPMLFDCFVRTLNIPGLVRGAKGALGHGWRRRRRVA